MRTSRAALVAGAVSIALAGCGGSSNKQLSYSDFISQLNDNCRKGEAEFTKVNSPDAAKPIIDKYLRKFKDLKPPDQLKAPYDRFVSITQQQSDALAKKDLDTFNSLSKDSDAAAAEIGARDCISNK